MQRGAAEAAICDNPLPAAIERNVVENVLEAVLFREICRFNTHCHEQAQCIYGDDAFASLDALVAIVAVDGPLFSAVLTDWVSMTTVLGVGGRP